jgi:hypothetical protein
MMLINDANTQPLVDASQGTMGAAGHEGRPFVNPLKPKTLRWMVTMTP